MQSSKAAAMSGFPGTNGAITHQGCSAMSSKGTIRKQEICSHGIFKFEKQCLKQQSDRKICNHLTPHSGTKRDQNRLELQARACSDCALLIRISLNISFTQNSCFASLYKSSRRVLVARLKNYPSRRYRLLHTLITSNTNN